MIAIVDYGMGNLRSVQKGFEKVGCAAQIVGHPDELAAADRIVLPGVGAFGDAMIQLDQRGLIEPLRAAIDAGKPFLGICLGLQLLFEVSQEEGLHGGLGVLAGEVIRFAATGERKVPHMGWNQVHWCRRAPILDGIADGQYFYFVHSYFVVPRDLGVVAGETSYGARFCCAIWRDNLFATQFHPEKSQSEGLRILRNFAALSV